MIVWLRHLLGWVVSVVRSREDLILENLALRQQLLALHARRPRRRLSAMQKFVLAHVEKTLGRMAEASASGYAENGGLNGIGLAFGCIGSGSQEPDPWVDGRP